MGLVRLTLTVSIKTDSFITSQEGNFAQHTKPSLSIHPGLSPALLIRVNSYLLCQDVANLRQRQVEEIGLKQARSNPPRIPHNVSENASCLKRMASVELFISCASVAYTQPAAGLSILGLTLDAQQRQCAPPRSARPLVSARFSLLCVREKSSPVPQHWNVSMEACGKPVQVFEVAAAVMRILWFLPMMLRQRASFCRQGLMRLNTENFLSFHVFSSFLAKFSSYPLLHLVALCRADRRIIPAGSLCGHGSREKGGLHDWGGSERGGEGEGKGEGMMSRGTSESNQLLAVSRSNSRFRLSAPGLISCSQRNIWVFYPELWNYSPQNHLIALNRSYLGRSISEV